mmetsp:Transcript_54091/g.89782  ORF Transcript_54091/g.89782 Transcript_54091/m.89782 type:complete len:157 (-) Transcript_54091:409-879(-)|eukprot:CAMPEP_0119310858 /NCGR_PEP_ID=MMETSP1333-20130426/20560_1 /TAXON_ID=418940 /ORGANISM="Scyphosphaera apsteinii, Strain RCC1455" /LENGTH=156 /DNA_ID=CAMNT_0007315119 /DNA_START=179 /DNA_END=649 /DNA_ORIENTATION=+
MEKIERKRLAYTHQGRTIYEWEQSLEDVTVFITPPPGVTAKMLDCKIEARRLTLGLKGNPPFIDELFEETVNSSDSCWFFENGELTIQLTKGSKGKTWPAVFQGHTKVDPFTMSECNKSLMLERFQAENPGFDFSGASFNGQVPDPKTFMGGVGYK